MFKTIVAALALFCACSDDSVTCEEVTSTWCEVQYTCNLERNAEALRSCIDTMQAIGCEDINSTPADCLDAVESFVWDCSLDTLAQLDSYARHVGPACWGE